ncbi:MAG: DUF4358 domain-containing protein [Clostridiaceae bacterium]|nr:DUF4358 domain-containing protein [Clostridiaceae bacterium]
MKNTFLVCALCLMLLFSACTATAPSKPVADIYASIESAGLLPEMLTLDNDYIQNYYAIDLSSVDEHVFSIASDVVRADTVILLRVTGDKTAVKDALTLILNQKLAEMENYLPEQYQIVKKSSVVVNGDLVSLVISPDRDAIYDIINK